MATVGTTSEPLQLQEQPAIFAPTPAPAPTASAVEERAEEAQGAEEAAPPKRSYRQQQRQCLRCCCGSLGLIVLTGIALFSTYVIGNDQCYYDPCYLHIRADSPEIPSNITPNSPYILPHNYTKAHSTCTAKTWTANAAQLQDTVVVWLL